MDTTEVYDFVIIGSGFGGSVSGMRLTEKGYKVLVLERGKRYDDKDFPKSNWAFWKFLWNPFIRSFGIFQMSLMSGMIVFRGAGVGGGSLVYANVLEEPSDKLYSAPSWKNLADWKTLLHPHYQTAKRMLGVSQNPRLFHADDVMRSVAEEMDRSATFRPTNVGIFFGEDGSEEGQEYPDPYFGGLGPSRKACIHCGACIVGCRDNAKNTLPKNYLYFAEKWGAEVRPKALVTDIHPLDGEQPDKARYEVVYTSPMAVLFKPEKKVRARNVIVSAGTMGTIDLLLRCRDITASLPNISAQLGEEVRTNGEGFAGSIARNNKIDYSKGISIGSIFLADEETAAEPLRFNTGSGLIRMIAGTLVDKGNHPLARLLRMIVIILRHPIDYINATFLPRWANRATIFLIMQTSNNFLRVRMKRNLWTLFRRGLVAEQYPDRPFTSPTEITHHITRSFAGKSNGIPAVAINETLLNVSSTAHLMGGCSLGRTPEEGVVDLDFQVFNYPGLYVVDGTTVPANPGVNPSLTITALAEYAMSRIPVKEGYKPERPPLGVG